MCFAASENLAKLPPSGCCCSEDAPTCQSSAGGGTNPADRFDLTYFVRLIPRSEVRVGFFCYLHYPTAKTARPHRAEALPPASGQAYGTAAEPLDRRLRPPAQKTTGLSSSPK